MQPSRRQFLIGSLALGAAPVLAQDEPPLPKDGKEPQKFPYVLSPEEFDFREQRKQWEEERRDMLERYELCTKLERILLGRFLAPIDDWLNLNAYAKEKEFKRENVFDDPVFIGDEPIWLLLKIRSANPLDGDDIWIKFSFGKDDIQSTLEDDTSEEGGFDADGNRKKKLVPEPVIKALWRKRDALMQALEHHLVQLLDDADSVKTMVDGTAGLYRIHGPDADPAKVTKEQILK